MTDFNKIRADIESSAATHNVNLNDAALPYSVWLHNGQENYFPTIPTSFKTMIHAQAKADQMPGQAVILGVDSESGKVTMMIRQGGKCADDGLYSWF